MKRLSLALLLLPMVATADILTVTWEHPTLREDNSIIAVEEIKETIIDYSCRSTTDSVKVPAPDTIIEVEIKEHGRCDFTAKTVDIYGQVSIPSEATSHTILPSPPGSPTFVNIVIKR